MSERSETVKTEIKDDSIVPIVVADCITFDTSSRPWLSDLERLNPLDTLESYNAGLSQSYEISVEESQQSGFTWELVRDWNGLFTVLDIGHSLDD